MKSLALLPHKERQAFKDILLKQIFIFILTQRVLDNDVFSNLGSDL